jgi:hypothetical protein
MPLAPLRALTLTVGAKPVAGWAARAPYVPSSPCYRLAR